MSPIHARLFSLVAAGLFLPAIAAIAQEPAVAEATAEVTKEAATGAFPLVSRWLHVLGAIFLLGGTFYLRNVLVPAAKETLDEDTHQKLRAGVMKQWRKYLHVLILVLLVTGLYNFLAVTRFAHDGQPTYHMLFGIKFLLAIAVFGLATMLAGKKSVSVKLQQNSGLWLGIALALGVAIVLIAGYMKMM